MDSHADYASAAGPEGIGESFFFELPPAPQLLDVGEGDVNPTVEFRRTLGMFATGVTVITTQGANRVHGMTANAFMSVSLHPPLILISIDRRAKMNVLMREGVSFGVSVLEAGQTAVSDLFAGRIDEDAPEPPLAMARETPVIEGALAQVVARLVRCYWGGDHSLFLGRVEHVRYGDGTPLLFHGGRYERIVRHPQAGSVLPAALLAPVLASGVERRYADGETIRRAGDPADSLAYVVEGTARVHGEGRAHVVRAGGFLDEIGVLGGGPSAAEVVAEGPVRCREISRHDLMLALEAEPSAAIALAETLARRLLSR